MKKVLFILLYPLLLTAQFQFIPISADFASFVSTDSTAFVQIYLSLYQGNLSYTKEADETYSSTFTTQLEVNQDQTAVKQLAHKYKNSVADTAVLKNYNQFIDVFSLELPFGEYKAKVTLSDNNSHLKGEYILDLKTITPQPGIWFSDIQLCTEIKSDTTKNMFHKNGLRVVPNPKAVYDLLNPLFYYYVEINQLSYSAEGTNQYTFEYALTNSAGDTLRKKPTVTKNVIASTLVEAGGMNVMALPRDIYFFNIKAVDLASGAEITARKKMMVYKPVKKSEQQQSETLPDIADFYNGFTIEQLTDEFKQAKYISSRQEEKVFNNLENAPAMQKFLTQFWHRKDKERELKFGTFRREYLKRIAIATEKYTSFGKKGWKTDMGRVFILYGEPDEYERHPNSIDRVPYVVWHFHNLEGGAQFIFADEEGFGQFQLLHSTYRKELQNPNWEQILLKQTGTNPY